jgi:5-methylcytosine-specific restriction endonuclease McrA
MREIAERDGWRCHLCGRRVPDRPYRASPNDPTLDHLVPVSAGGDHTRANVALAHNRCNYERRADGPAQMRLFG